MKLITCLWEGDTVLGVLQGDTVIIPALGANRSVPADMLSLIRQSPQSLDSLRKLAAKPPSSIIVPYDEVHLLAPIPHPQQNVLCLGWNYSEHIKETTNNAQLEQQELPKHPIVFTKDSASVNGPYDDIPYDPEVSSKIDWEVELAIVVGKLAHKVKQENAYHHVFGYTIVNDITARDLQKRHRQFFLGKSLPGSCPMGPCIVTADEIEDPQALQIESRVNGVVKQQSSTAYQIFGVVDLIVRLSHILPLYPGTIIATGTPSGVGYVRKPPQYLADGDVVECEVEGIGCLRNTMVSV